MLNRTILRRNLSSKIGLSVSVGVFIWIVLLVNGSIAIKDSSEANYKVTYGPLLLNTLTKQKIDGGAKAAISFEPNIVYYLILWAAIGAVIGLVVDQLNPKKT